MSTNNKKGFIAVHVGAGQHSASLKEKYQKLCRDACKVGAQSLKSNGNVLDAVVEAVMILEDSPMTNAGFGSNLTLNGTVECDASVMDGSSLQYGAVGAVSGIKNPVLLAKRLCEQQSIKFAYGRIPPSFLVGNGAHIWAHEMGIQILPPEQLISVKAQKIYKHYKRKLESCSAEVQKCAKKRMDTVGAICVDNSGNIAAACSSGGIILKYPGRVGQAGVWGCGTWACKDTSYSVGTSTSGCGEHLVRTSLARTIAEAISDTSCPTTSLHRAMSTDFIDSKFLCGLEQKLGGVIAVRYSPQEGLGDFLWSHSTNSMIIGYMNTCERASMSYMSALPSHEVGKKAVVEGVCFKLAGLDEV
ncbi:PREDICTED: threonine aspartase 1 [Trachymyrmex cornetzi]|uniref:Threonine aspartase 1 n=1 Tax=Trachymyrmex cornetzi TaxID=471704 RepID=A0A195E400_9HYME|nr:PREDICTED: threonine aspartase 1 [Trachymyrmex cornetzi]XP_018363021.1 PREDICTED: threonine aspartase 1 [Trachymyrmex cornetzi]XP_018363022.1 PREDICTED: threonine aspartase 1 [Trachymyrmex cornetzi]KYN19910.1 Threonine aspartase 1 [Trachymyrmex cornetzi]